VNCSYRKSCCEMAVVTKLKVIWLNKCDFLKKIVVTRSHVSSVGDSPEGP
jgi:hypothetical protein